MNHEDLTKRWNGYCSEYVPVRPVGFDAASYVFDVADVQASEKLSKQFSSDDKLKKLNFHLPSADRGLGTFERSREEMSELTRFLDRGNIRMAFGYEPGSGDDIHVVGDAKAIADRDIWFVGDIHGDLLALRAMLAFVSSNSVRRPVFVFLGDLFDRNPFGLNVLIEVMRLLRDDPDSVFVIAGNHDDGLEWSERGFSSRITPHQFSDEMNAFGDETTKEFVKAFIRFAKKLPVGLVLPNGLFATHGGVPSRPERAVKNIWEGLDAKGIRRLISEKRSEFLCNRFQKDVSTGTKLSPDFSWVEIINFSEAVEKAYGVKVRSMVRGHDHCDLCRHDWARSTFAGNDNCPPEKAERVRDVLTMTSMVMMYKEENLPGFFQEKIACPTVARYRADDVRPEVVTVRFDVAAALQYCKDAQRPIEIEQARVVAARKASVVAERDRLRQEQESVAKELKEQKNRQVDLERNVEKAGRSLDTWKKQKEQLSSRPVKDNEHIVELREKIMKAQRVLDDRRRDKLKRDQQEQEGKITLTRLDDLGAAIKKKCQQVVGATDEDKRADIEEWQEEIKRETEKVREHDPELLKADENVKSADLALAKYRQFVEECKAKVAVLERRLQELVSELNKNMEEITNCKEAEEILGKEAK